jgi:hypothetical protein
MHQGFKLMAFHSQCIYCGAKQNRRSRRRELKERMMWMILRAPYRCLRCNDRYYGWYFGPKKNERDYSFKYVLNAWLGLIVGVLGTALIILLVVNLVLPPTN